MSSQSFAGFGSLPDRSFPPRSPRPLLGSPVQSVYKQASALGESLQYPRKMRGCSYGAANQLLELHRET